MSRPCGPTRPVVATMLGRDPCGWKRCERHAAHVAPMRGVGMSERVVRLPDVGEGVAEAELVSWQVAVGDVVHPDSVLAEVLTDKATVEVFSPVAGRVTFLRGTVGEVLAVGSDFVGIETDADAPAPDAARPPEPAPTPAPGPVSGPQPQPGRRPEFRPEPESRPEPASE